MQFQQQVQTTKIWAHITKIEPDIVAKYEHVAEIERHIHTVKEIVQSTWNKLPFKNILTRIIIYMVTGMDVNYRVITLFSLW